MREDIKSVEILCRSADNLMRDIAPQKAHTRDDVSL
jgi:hypothetical protein